MALLVTQGLYITVSCICVVEKDLIIIRGRNHDPALVEQALDGLPGLRRLCSGVCEHARKEPIQRVWWW